MHPTASSCSSGRRPPRRSSCQRACRGREGIPPAPKVVAAISPRDAGAAGARKTAPGREEGSGAGGTRVSGRATDRHLSSGLGGDSDPAADSVKSQRRQERRTEVAWTDVGDLSGAYGTFDRPGHGSYGRRLPTSPASRTSTLAHTSLLPGAVFRAAPRPPLPRRPPHAPRLARIDPRPHIPPSWCRFPRLAPRRAPAPPRAAPRTPPAPAQRPAPYWIRTRIFATGPPGLRK